jgi:hypothetical protein
MSLEEGARTARSFVDALKSQPLALALVVMNFVLLAYLFYSGHQTAVLRNDYLRETQQILAKCVSVEDFDRLQRLLRNQQ